MKFSPVMLRLIHTRPFPLPSFPPSLPPSAHTPLQFRFHKGLQRLVGGEELENAVFPHVLQVGQGIFPLEGVAHLGWGGGRGRREGGRGSGMIGKASLLDDK